MSNTIIEILNDCCSAEVSGSNMIECATYQLEGRKACNRRRFFSTSTDSTLVSRVEGSLLVEGVCYDIFLGDCW